MAVEHAFWDSSGLVLLVTHQRSSPAALSLRRARSRIVVWWGARVEVRSALARLRRTGRLDASELGLAVARLEALARVVVEVSPTEQVRARAERVIDARDVRAADAMQLGAALEWCRNKPRGRPFVCFDARLAAAAREEHFDVRP